MPPFATVSDPLTLAESDTFPSESLYQIESEEVPQSGAERDRYEAFKTLCTEKEIPAGIMGLLWHHLENDLTIIDVDTSRSMGCIDGVQAPEKQTGVEIMHFGKNNARSNARSQPQTRMQEAQERLLDIVPLLCTANRHGIINLKSLSDPQGLRLDMRHTPHQLAIQNMNAFIYQLRPNLDHTPSVTSYHNSCQVAQKATRTGRVKSATIINFSDGEPNQRPDRDVEEIYNAYHRHVLVNRQDHQRADGSRVPHNIAVRWNMGVTASKLMRQLSVLAGHYNIPTTIAACTNDEAAMGEQNEFDDIHTNVAVLDDFIAEQNEVLRQQGIRFPFNKAMYLALNFIAPKEAAFDNLDEAPLAPHELEKVLGYYPGHDAYLQNLETSLTAVEATTERPLSGRSASAPQPPSYFR